MIKRINERNPIIMDAGTTLKLTEKQLEKHGKKLLSTGESIGLFLKTLVRKLIHGSAESEEKKSEFLKSKTFKVIKEINVARLREAIPGINEKGKFFNHVLNAFVEDNAVLGKDSQTVKEIKTMHDSFSFVDGLNVETHWLKDFATEDDLGKSLSGIDIKNQSNFDDAQDWLKTVKVLVELDRLNQSSPTDFVPLLKEVLSGGALKSITPDQINDFKEYVRLRQELAGKPGEGIESTKKLFLMVKILESKKDSEFGSRFEKLLLDQPQIFALLNSQYLPNNQLVDVAERLLTADASIPEDIGTAKSYEEIIGKLEDEKNKGNLEVKEKRFGKQYSLIDESKIAPEDRKELESIEKNFRLCGQTSLFAELMNKAIKNPRAIAKPEQFRAVLEEFKKDHPLYLHATKQVAVVTRGYAKAGISAEKIERFQQGVLSKVLNLKGLDSAALHVKGTKGISEVVHEQTVKFNSAELKEAKADWEKEFGKAIADQLSAELSDSVKKGEAHFQESPVAGSRVADMSKAFSGYNGDHLRATFGDAFAGHAMRYLTGPEGTEKRQEAGFREEWNRSIESFSRVKEACLRNGITESEFEEKLERFLTGSAHANAQEDNWVIFSGKGPEVFICSVNVDKMNEKFESLAQTHGKEYISILTDYLKDNEPDVLIGEIGLADALFYQADSFADEVQFFLMPYILQRFESLKPFSALSKEVILNAVSGENVTPGTFKNRLDNLLRLQALATKGIEGARNQQLARAIVTEIASPYLMQFDHDTSKALSAKETKENVLKREKIANAALKNIVKFCNGEFDKTGIYSPEILARATRELLDGDFMPSKDKVKDPLKRLQTIANEMDSIINGKIKKEFNTRCVDLLIESSVKKTCEKEFKAFDTSMERLVRGITQRLAHSEEGFKTPQSVKYVQDLIEFGVGLTAGNPDKVPVILDELSRSSMVTFDLKEINKKASGRFLIPDDTKARIAKNVEDKTIEKTQGIVRVLQDNPFGIVYEAVPRFLDGFLPDKDKNQVAAIRKGLVPLGPMFNNSAFVQVGVNAAVRAANTAIELKALDSENLINPDGLKTIIETTVGKFNALNLEEAFAEKTNRAQYKDALQEQGLGIFGTVADEVLVKLSEIRRNIDHPAEGVEPAGPEVIFKDILPKIVNDRKWIVGAIGVLSSMLPIIRKVGAGFIVGKFISYYLSSQIKDIKSLDPATQQLITESINPIISGVLLAAPALLEKHDINFYFDFLEKLNTAMQNGMKAEDRDALFVDILKVMQQATKEGAEYEVLLLDVLTSTVDSLLK